MNAIPSLRSGLLLLSTVTSLIAVPAWSQDVGAQRQARTTVDTPTTHTANFGTQYYLTIMIDPPGGGTVSTNPPSPDGYYDAGPLELTANPNAGYQFASWGGDFSGTANPLNMTLSNPHTVVARFTSVLGRDPNAGVPTFALQQNTPNPFAVNTTLVFSLPRRAPVTLRIFDLRGRLVKTLASGQMEAGSHTVHWNGTDQSGHPTGDGIYMALLRCGSLVQSRRLTLIR